MVTKKLRTARRRVITAALVLVGAAAVWIGGFLWIQQDPALVIRRWWPVELLAFLIGAACAALPRRWPLWAGLIAAFGFLGAGMFVTLPQAFLFACTIGGLFVGLAVRTLVASATIFKPAASHPVGRTTTPGPQPGDAEEVLQVFTPVPPGEPQMLMRQLTAPATRWFEDSPSYELRWYPEGRDHDPAWTRVTDKPERELPRRMHVQDWSDVRGVARDAWEQHDPRFVSWTESLYQPSGKDAGSSASSP